MLLVAILIVALVFVSIAAALPPLVPWPEDVDELDGDPVRLDPAMIRVDGEAAVVGERLVEYLGDAPADGAAIHLKLDPSADVGEAGYTLVCDESGVTITAATTAGLFYGGQTLRQLAQLDLRAPGDPIVCPRVRIVDRPRFGWRGLLLDSGRYMQSVAQIERLIDLLAQHKLNRLHWHLTEDQGWRLQIDRYPRLTEIGSKRAESPRRGDRKAGDGTPYGGFYTKDQVRHVVAYAAERFVTVVPEIEIPGHSAAALAAYPQFGNTDIPGYAPSVLTRWGVHPYTYAPTPEALEFIGHILDEVLELFPSEYLHIGGDEAPADQWQQSPAARAFMKQHGLDDPHHVQAWFNEHLDAFLAARGRRMIGWDEILGGPLSKRVAVMSWRGVEGGQKAAAEGHDVVMAPGTHTYFDHYQADPATEPEAIAGHTTVEKAYSFNPTDGIAAEHQHHVLGVQGQLWTEYIWDDAKLEYMAFPRTCALSEVAWTPQAGRDWEHFQPRLAGHLDRLRSLRVNFRQLDGGPAFTPVE